MTRLRVPIPFLVLIASIYPLSAQEFRSTISGRVIDQQQAVVPGASVAAVQIENGARHESVTGADGQYTLPFVLPGNYCILVEAPGFKRHVREGVLISANG